MGKNARVIALAALMSLGLASGARAQDREASPQSPSHDARGVLRLGKLYTFGGGTDLNHGFGMDLRYELYPDGREDGYVGLFSSGQYELADAWRFAGGVTGGWGFFGLEVGVSHRTETASYAGSTGLHIGQSFTFGPLSIGGRLTLPLYDSVQQNTASVPLVQGIEGAITVRLSWGFTLHGPPGAQHGCGAHAQRGPGHN